jgi:hypothetical protein
VPSVIADTVTSTIDKVNRSVLESITWVIEQMTSSVFSYTQKSSVELSPTF